MMKKNTRKGIILFLSFILLFSLPFEVRSNGLTPHAPIQISGNAQFTPQNGVVGGSGTASDPYIIEGWDIDISTGSYHGISISNTNAYFVIRNCSIHGGYNAYNNGISFYNVRNGKIENCTIYNNYYGIIFEYQGSNNIIVSNNVYGNGEGIYLTDFSTNNIIISNNIHHNVSWYIFRLLCSKQ
ncbi:MAG: right-handed parallel beta-helix repeat-containing protein [Candidatus Thermoplasmatota archaeon]